MTTMMMMMMMMMVVLVGVVVTRCALPRPHWAMYLTSISTYVHDTASARAFIYCDLHTRNIVAHTHSYHKIHLIATSMSQSPITPTLGTLRYAKSKQIIIWHTKTCQCVTVCTCIHAHACIYSCMHLCIHRLTIQSVHHLIYHTNQRLHASRWLRKCLHIR
jgi:hypothetical protein